jgi:hypothetical protein
MARAVGQQVHAVGQPSRRQPHPCGIPKQQVPAVARDDFRCWWQRTELFLQGPQAVQAAVACVQVEHNMPRRPTGNNGQVRVLPIPSADSVQVGCGSVNPAPQLRVFSRSFTFRTPTARADKCAVGIPPQSPHRQHSSSGCGVGRSFL